MALGGTLLLRGKSNFTVAVPVGKRLSVAQKSSWIISSYRTGSGFASSLLSATPVLRIA